MAPNRHIPSHDPIAEHWQFTLQYALEAGIAPQLALGQSADALTALGGLAALQQMFVTRTDMSAPLITAGGASGAWLAALMQPQAGAPTYSPPAQTLFMGSDAGSALAAAGTLPLPPRGLHPADDRVLPNGYRAALAPALQPAAPFAWEGLPWRALEPEAGLAALRAPGNWLAWGGLLLALALVVGALLV